MRYAKWIEKCKAKKTSISELKRFPPTLEAAQLNVKRAHFQCSIWKNLKLERPASLDAEKYGWKKDTANKSLEILCLENNTPIAPDVLMKITFCGCSSAEPCKSNKCGCRQKELKCSVLCKCTGTCCNSNQDISTPSDDLSAIDHFGTEEDNEEEEDLENYTDDDSDDDA